MEHFSLDKWLEDKSRKIRTRDGRSVRIVCWDKLDDRPAVKEQKIVALVKEGEKENENVFMYNNKDDGCISALDLFFVDEEEKLTEFEKAVQNILNEPHFQDVQAVKQFSKTLLDLARKEILKDFPKWKKDEKDEELDCHVAIQQDSRVVLSDFVQKDEYYITLDVLKTLPKEE